VAKSTREKELERARERRRAAHADRKQATTLVIALVAVLVVGAIALGAVLLARGGGPASPAETATGEQYAADEAATDDTAAASATGSMDAPVGALAAEPCPVASGELPTPTLTPYTSQPNHGLAAAASVSAVVETTCGTIVLELDAAAAPQTVGNFVALAEDGYYDGVGFHRVIEGFMIQGGDPTGTGSGCLDDSCAERLPGYTFADELTLAEEVVAEAGGYPRGTLAMANAGPDTNGSQFFVVQGTPGYPLPPQYAVFGAVTSGMDVVDRIAQGPVDGQIAVDPVVILSVTVQP
jgi:cyclophilin family peptidyl-prolyl cis-trans isomerase